MTIRSSILVKPRDTHRLPSPDPFPASPPKASSRHTPFRAPPPRTLTTPPVPPHLSPASRWEVYEEEVRLSCAIRSRHELAVLHACSSLPSTRAVRPPRNQVHGIAIHTSRRQWHVSYDVAQKSEGGLQRRPDMSAWMRVAVMARRARRSHDA